MILVLGPRRCRTEGTRKLVAFNLIYKPKTASAWRWGPCVFGYIRTRTIGLDLEFPTTLSCYSVLLFTSRAKEVSRLPRNGPSGAAGQGQLLLLARNAQVIGT